MTKQEQNAYFEATAKLMDEAIERAMIAYPELRERAKTPWYLRRPISLSQSFDVKESK